jgi:hypothetical protein
VAKKQAKSAGNPYLTASSPDELGPSESIAYEIVADRRDLLPSVERIMNAGLDDGARLRALTLFRDSLGRDRDPNRDPRVSIANSGGAQTTGDRS